MEPYIYVTGKLCNRAFRKMPKDSRYFAKSLIYLNLLKFPGISRMPESDAPIIFSLSPVTTGPVFIKPAETKFCLKS